MNRENRKLVSTTIYLTPQQKQKLEMLTKITLVPWSRLVRAAIDELIKKKEDEGLVLEPRIPDIKFDDWE